MLQINWIIEKYNLTINTRLIFIPYLKILGMRFPLLRENQKKFSLSVNLLLFKER